MYEQLGFGPVLATFTSVNATSPDPSPSDTSPGASMLLPEPSTGRVFTGTRRVSIDDCSPAGKMQFDAIARFLQDIGNDDTDDAEFGDLGLAWVARRALITVDTPAQSREDLTLSTWCSGTGRRWAERRTSISGASGAVIDGVTIWIHLDPETGKPIPWGDEFASTYLPATDGRRVDARLRLPKSPNPADVLHSAPWSFRVTDSDAFGHVNNTAYLAAAEEFLDLDGPCSLELEWRTPCRAGDRLTAVTSSEGRSLHLIDDDSGETRAVFAVTATTP